MFSVIIPLYNKAPYVEKAIRSVLNQTLQDFELIVIDDGSTDNSFEVVQQLFSSLTPPSGGWGAYTQQNQGVSTTRNKGVSLAKYDYIAFLDADDWWAPTYLEEMKKLIEEFPQAGIYGSSYYKVKNGKHIPAKIGVEQGFEKGIINYFRVYANTMWMPLWTGATILKKEIYIQENGFKPQLKLGEDFDLWVRIAIKHPVALLNKPLAYYNQDVEQASRGVVDDKIYDPATYVTFNFDFLQNEESLNNDLKNLLDKLRVISLLRYRLSGAYKEQVNEIISKVDFLKIDKVYYRYYHYPLCLVRLWYQFRKFGSKVKFLISTLKIK